MHAYQHVKVCLKLSLYYIGAPSEEEATVPTCEVLSQIIMAYGSTPYVGMTPKKNGGHIESAQMTHSKCLR